jgi:hypothetical protein
MRIPTIHPYEAKEAFDYRDGIVFWRVRPCHRVQVGDVAGTLKTTPNASQNQTIRFKGHRIMRSWLVWALHYGVWPESTVFHLNGQSNDDRIENLRVIHKGQPWGGDQRFAEAMRSKSPPPSYFSENPILPANTSQGEAV